MRKNEYMMLREEMMFKQKRFDFPILSIISSILFWGLRGWNFIVYDSWILTSIVLIIQVLIVGFEILLYFKYSSVATIKKKLIKNWEVVLKNEKEFSYIK